MAQTTTKSVSTKKTAVPLVSPKKAAEAKPKATSSKSAVVKEAAKVPAKKASPKAASAPAKGNGEMPVPPKVARKAPAKKAESRPRSIGGVTPEQRYRMICDAAYFRAERRGFVGGNAVQDWLDAESEIDELLREMQP